MQNLPQLSSSQKCTFFDPVPVGVGAIVGSLILKGLGLRFAVAQLPMKSLLACAGMTMFAGDAGNIIYNAACRSDQKEKRLKLVALAVSMIVTTVLSQNGYTRSLPYIGRVFSLVPQLFVSHAQTAVVAGVLSITSLAMQCIFNHHSGATPLGEPSQSVPSLAANEKRATSVEEPQSVSHTLDDSDESDSEEKNPLFKKH